MSISSLDASNAAVYRAETLAATSRACVADAVEQDAVAASLEKRISSMVARAADAVSTTVARSNTLLAAGAQYTAAVRSAADRNAKMLHKHLEDDVIAEADSNVEQLASWSALSASSPCVDCFDFAYSAVLLGDASIFSSTAFTPFVVLCVASVETDVDVAHLHRIFSSDIDAARSTVGGQGLLAFDPEDSAAARQQNVIHVVPRDVDGVIVKWVTSADISLALLPGVVIFGLLLSYDVCADAEGWRVAYTVGGARTGESTIRLQLHVNGVRLWQGEVMVRVALLFACYFTLLTVVWAFCVCTSRLKRRCPPSRAPQTSEPRRLPPHRLTPTSLLLLRLHFPLMLTYSTKSVTRWCTLLPWAKLRVHASC